MPSTAQAKWTDAAVPIGPSRLVAPWQARPAVSAMATVFSD